MKKYLNIKYSHTDSSLQWTCCWTNLTRKTGLDIKIFTCFFHHFMKIINFSWLFEYGGLFQQFFLHFCMIRESLETEKIKCTTLGFTFICLRNLYGKEQRKYAIIFYDKRKKSYCISLLSTFPSPFSYPPFSSSFDV